MRHQDRAAARIKPKPGLDAGARTAAAMVIRKRLVPSASPTRGLRAADYPENHRIRHLPDYHERLQG